MKFISYAQNFEDVILQRAFKGQDRGFYIDVGAAHPSFHSVTKHFYDSGWQGINVEPLSFFFNQLENERVRDINLNIGLSDTSGEAIFYEAPNSMGLSTFSASSTSYWKSQMSVEFVERTAPIMTLAQVCERYVEQPIDFLKLDVEGLEHAAIEGGDFTRWRPRIVLVEGYRELYQAKLLASGYLHAAFDGVNHYFVREDERHLIGLLSAPVSLVVDDFELHEYTRQISDLHRLLDEERALHEETKVMLAEAIGLHQSALALHNAPPVPAEEGSRLAGRLRSVLRQLGRRAG
jgi:FkbM family methyltransferase